ncbi:Fic family protein [Candidatus Woesearchaeota archaeon]|nr:Fic family protein [Candidatus Woesearchaeota archaeon]
MVIVRKRRIGNEEFFYLEHTIRVNGKIEKKERYLGKVVPENINIIKQEFFHELFKEKWYSLLNRIKKIFSGEYSKFPETAKQKYLETFLIKFTYNTNRIEGSTLTLRDTANLLKEGISPKNKPVKDIKEAESHKKLFNIMRNYKKDLNLNTVLYWHRVLLKDIDEETAGKIRDHQVAIAGTTIQLPYPVELNILLEEFFKWYNQAKNKLHPVELAALVHLKFVSIHPFTDGNGRISRILMNFVLNKNNFPMLDISYSNRSSYYTALERSQKTGKEYIFVQYLIKRYFKEYKKYTAQQ